MIELEKIIVITRKRLKDFRLKNSDSEISIHIIAFEIAISLTEFSLKTNPSRKISEEEEQWFNAGFQIYQVLVNSEWEDMIDLYYKTVEYVEKKNFFR